MIKTIESDKPNMARQYFVDKAIGEAALVLENIDGRWPIPEQPEKRSTRSQMSTLAT
jgi:hypothetical protein